MATTLLPPPEVPASERDPLRINDNGNGFGGGNFDESDYGWHGDPDPSPGGSATPLSAYRTVTLFAMVWIATFFITLARIVVPRWTHSKAWILFPLPHALYVSAAVLIAGSLTIEFARSRLRAGANRRCAVWLSATLLFALAFVGGQIVAWRAFSLHGLYLALDLGTLFFYIVSGAYTALLLIAVAGLAYAASVVRGYGLKEKQRTAVGVVSMYWHFMGALWLCLLALLFVTIQR